MRLPRQHLSLPAPIAVTTSRGRFQLARDGRVSRTSSDPQPVPHCVTAWWPTTGVWERIEHRHLVLGRYQRQLWRSRGRFPLAYQLDAITVGRDALAFSYGWRRPQLYLAPLGGGERRVASGEFPLGWTAGGLYTHRAPGGQLLLRSPHASSACSRCAQPVRSPASAFRNRVRSRSRWISAGGNQASHSESSSRASNSANQRASSRSVFG
jgi:hypothetical protein